MTSLRWPLVAVCLFAASLLGERAARADEDRPDHTIGVGIGGAIEVEAAYGTASSGANVMVEWDAVEDWLELELEASVLAGGAGVEVPADLLFKKPFTVAPWAEFMVGLGPEIVQVTGSGKGTYVGGEAALDFMFWPSHRFGLWIEPSYDVVDRGGTASAGAGATGGLLVGW